MDTKTLCLAVLQRGDASGYEIKKTLEQLPYRLFQETGFGSIYPALTRLSEEGLVRVTEMAQQKRPDKKIYSLTPAGREVLIEALAQDPAPDRYRSDFLFVLFHGHLLPAERIAEILDQRIEALKAELEGLQGCTPGPDCLPTRRFVYDLGVDHYRSALDFLQRNRDRLIAELTGEVDAAGHGDDGPRRVAG